MYPKSTIITMNTIRLAASGNYHAMYRISSAYGQHLFTTVGAQDAFQLFAIACICYLEGDCKCSHVAFMGERLFKAIESFEGMPKKPLVY